MPKTNKSVKAGGKTMLAKASKDMPVLRAIKGGKATPPKPSPAKPAVKPLPGAVADEMPGQARFRAQCPARLRLRHGEAGNLRRHVQRPDARGLRPLKARARDDCC